MGTHYSITVVDPEERIDDAVLQQQVEQRLEEVNQTFSTYLEDSELNRFNRSAIDRWQPVSEDLYTVLLAATEAAWLSEGAFDATIGPLVRLWGFGPDGPREQAPAERELQQALARVGYQHLELDMAELRARRRADIELDLSGIAKGYGVDALAQLLAEQGIGNFLVEIGGELAAAGHNPRGQPWRIAVERPVGADERGVQPLQALRITGVGLATSGDYRNYFEQEGEHYSHTIDPGTGRPVKHRLTSVSVVADTAMWADALATAMMAMGPEKAMDLAEQLGVGVFLVLRGETGDRFEVRYNAALEPYLDTEGP